jgi:hypothetical protein
MRLPRALGWWFRRDYSMPSTQPCFGHAKKTTENVIHPLTPKSYTFRHPTQRSEIAICVVRIGRDRLTTIKTPQEQCQTSDVFGMRRRKADARLTALSATQHTSNARLDAGHRASSPFWVTSSTSSASSPTWSRRSIPVQFNTPSISQVLCGARSFRRHGASGSVAHP